jgi:hypothetical protein
MMKKKRWKVICPAVIIAAGLILVWKLYIWQYRKLNTVSNWNAALEQAEINSDVPTYGRSAAILNVAIFDAVNGIRRQYKPYKITSTAPVGANAESAADEAAYTVAISLYPDQKSTFNKLLFFDLSRISANPISIFLGMNWGRYVANEILEWRKNDNLNEAIAPYVGSNKAGKWRPVDGEESGDHPEHADLVTFGVKYANQFLPGPPPSITSVTYKNDLDLSRKFGGIISKCRTEEQTANAQFLSDNIYYRWNRIARNFVNDHVSIEDSARIFAILDIATSDAGITTWKAKYTYGFWRPETAIINDDNSEDRNWSPLIFTPNHPEYVCNHCSVSGAASTVLTHFFGNTKFSDSSMAVPGQTQAYSSFTALENDVEDARLYGGVHFRNSTVVGDTLGRRIGQYILANKLTPRRH